MEQVRIDKWLWAVRICKTRQQAVDMCRRGKVKVNGQNVKPSRLVVAGDAITVRRDSLDWQYEVLVCLEKRVGASAVSAYRKECTPEADIAQLRAIKRAPTPRRERGAGRPTKKERRELDRFMT